MANDLKSFDEALPALLRYFIHFGAGGYVLVHCNSQVSTQKYSSQIIKLLRKESLNLGIFNLDDANQNPYQVLKSHLDQNPNLHGLIIEGLYTLKQRPKELTELIFKINFQRDAIKSLGLPMLIWVSDAVLKEIQQNAVDFFTQRTGNVVFLQAEETFEPANLRITRPADDLLLQSYKKTFETQLDILGGKNDSALANRYLIPYLGQLVKSRENEAEVERLFNEYNRNFKKTDPFVLYAVGKVCDYLKLEIRAEEKLNKVLFQIQKKIPPFYHTDESKGEDKKNKLTSFLFQTLKSKGQEQFSLQTWLAGEETELLAKTYKLLGVLRYESNDIPLSITFSEIALALFHSLPPNNLYREDDRAGLYNNLGLCRLATGENDKAEKYFQQSLIIYQKLAGEAPNEFSHSLAMALNGYSSMKMSKGELLEAKTLLEEGLRIFENKTGNEHPFVEAILCHNLGHLHRLQKDWNLSTERYQKAIALREDLASTKTHVALADLAASHFGLAETYRDAKKRVKCFRHIRTAKALMEKAFQEHKKLYWHRMAEIYLFEAEFFSKYLPYHRIAKRKAKNALRLFSQNGMENSAQAVKAREIGIKAMMPEPLVKGNTYKAQKMGESQIKRAEERFEAYIKGNRKNRSHNKETI